MFKPTGNITALELGWHIVHAVRVAMPIGSGNLTGKEIGMVSSFARTGGWSAAMVDLMRGRSSTSADSDIERRGGTLAWQKKNLGWQALYFVNAPQYWHYPRYSAEFNRPEKCVLQHAIYATMFMSGNCAEMSSLAFIKLCQYFATFPEGHNVPDFLIERIKLPNPPFDHGLVKLTFKDSSIICDPWLNHAFVLNDENLEHWSKLCGPDGLFPSATTDTDLSLSEEERKSHWDNLKVTLVTHPCPHTVVKCSTQTQVKKFADLFEILYQRAIEQGSQNQIFDPRSRTSALTWQKRHLWEVYDTLLAAPPRDYYQNVNLKLIKAFLASYEFPKTINPEEVAEHMGFIRYMLEKKHFLPTQSAEDYLDLINADKDDALTMSSRPTRV